MGLLMGKFCLVIDRVICKQLSSGGILSFHIFDLFFFFILFLSENRAWHFSKENVVP